ncbi:MAG: glycoside hydrolase family 13 protein [Lachnospiraceae bacterium]|nr:glycoside hydrolase family 13 protein [Lachnospiraceae bacterium]
MVNTYETGILNCNSLFSDGSVRYRNPAEPMAGDDVIIRFRTAHNNVDGVSLTANGNTYNMQISRHNETFDYYETVIRVEDSSIQYFFTVNKGEQTVYYNRKGVTFSHEEYADFKIIPNFKTPDWAKGAVMYQIFVDRFYNGDRSNDVVDNEYTYINESVSKVSNWNDLPKPMDVGEFYGGDLQGVMNKLDYLKWLGIEVIYFNPLFVSPSSHKYDIQDYDYIDPHFGKIVVDDETLTGFGRYRARVTDKRNLEASNALFAELVNEAHKRGIKVIIDGVFNHCGSFNKWLDGMRLYENCDGYEKGAYISEDSPYVNYFKFNGGEWPYNRCYDGWWGHDTLPKLNYEESEQLYNYILDIAVKWVSEPYNADGWRLDVAADLGHSEEFNHRFWRDFRQAVKKANPDALILAEHYGNPSSWLGGDQWDSVMNYDAFMEPVSWFLTGMEKHSDEYREDLKGNAGAFFSGMRENMIHMTTQSLQVAMNELSNHDHSRFLTRTNRKVGRTATAGAETASQGTRPALMRGAVIIQMTWPGAPTVYYGDEAGLCGWTDPDNRRTYPWGHEDILMLNFHKELIRIHKDYEALRTGSLIFLYEEPDIIGYGRFDDDDKFLVVVNSGGEMKEVSVMVRDMEISDNTKMASLITSTEYEYSLAAKMYEITDGCVHITMPPYSSVVLKNVSIL